MEITNKQRKYSPCKITKEILLLTRPKGYNEHKSHFLRSLPYLCQVYLRHVQSIVGHISGALREGKTDKRDRKWKQPDDFSKKNTVNQDEN